ncbi:jg25653 [Pararge aegeria aegeria]|uniref:Jg25653 protein n=1 Tax=Pararge aegeria aegeria TaxID=348720 RepID=A0A8S4QWQ3_9NEOP|nr:jg25653 [Pararge aegeria aegeria]
MLLFNFYKPNKAQKMANMANSAGNELSYAWSYLRDQMSNEDIRRTRVTNIAHRRKGKVTKHVSKRGEPMDVKGPKMLVWNHAALVDSQRAGWMKSNES